MPRHGNCRVCRNVTVKLSDTMPGMWLLDKRQNEVCVVVGVNHDMGLIWLTGVERAMLRAEFDEREYERHDPGPAIVLTDAVG